MEPVLLHLFNITSNNVFLMYVNSLFTDNDDNGIKYKTLYSAFKNAVFITHINSIDMTNTGGAVIIHLVAASVS